MDTTIILPLYLLVLWLTLYHPGGSNGLLALCVCVSVCMSVCFCVLTITTLNVQMLRASLSGITCDRKDSRLQQNVLVGLCTAVTAFEVSYEEVVKERNYSILIHVF